jgi:hypothetical protein
MDLLTTPEVAEALEIEAVFDYWNADGPHGRGWKCDRAAWQVYDKKAFSGVPGDWIHVEISNRWADSPADIERIWNAVIAGELVAAPAPQPAPEPAPQPEVDIPQYTKTVKRGSRGDVVRAVQQRLADLGYENSSGSKRIVVDGRFGPNTERRVKDFQSDHPCPPVDGIVGPKTWAALHEK